MHDHKIRLTFSLKELITVTGFIICMILQCVPAWSQRESINPDITKQSFTYVTKDSIELGLDMYIHNGLKNTVKRPCVIFVFGGAFITGHRDDKRYNKYFNSLAEHDYITVSISYRLGLRGAKKTTVFNTAPLKKAIDMAVDDVYDATNWLIANADKFGIDTSKIILSGSSAGALTVLECDFLRRNNKEAAKKLPERFQYAGIISFSGAILSYDGSLKYAIPPAPVLLFHGTADKIMPYKKIRFFNKGFYGSSWIAKTFRKKGYPYYIFRAEGMGHEIALLPMLQQLPVILDFIEHFVIQQKHYQADMSFKDPDQKPIMIFTAKEMFKKFEQK